jgi:hypothetical protein
MNPSVSVGLLAAAAMVLAAPAAADPAAWATRVSAAVEAQAQADEGRVVVNLSLVLLADGAGPVPLDGFAVPLLVPVVRGAVVDRGTVPAAAQSVEVEAEGAQIERKQGALLLQGMATPDSPVRVQVRYMVPAPSPTVQLGLVGRARETQVTVAAGGVAPVRMRIESQRPARVSRVEQGRERLIGATLAQPLAAGEVAVFALRDVPGPPRVLARGLVWVAALAAVAAALWTWGVRQTGRA